MKVLEESQKNMSAEEIREKMIERKRNLFKLNRKKDESILVVPKTDVHHVVIPTRYKSDEDTLLDYRPDESPFITGMIKKYNKGEPLKNL
eukprot:CAMPEP_0116896852 /NCGR_PEP_ID=MMETSP0467-20121206/5995_1 /TAXON_ID=283647 /ORGANISM="Mesodinium pulex, Strain SPMC105" /LENGTH=89 /DNA_ID=CAMNT_0004568235 /DNA_START=327 /DNA_END=596 /DNA_ORIENTATION=-